jgi:large repetitive protein
MTAGLEMESGQPTRSGMRFSWTLALPLAALAAAAPATAQTPYLVRDINTAADATADTAPRNLVVAGGHLYFVGADDANGYEIRRLEADGTVTLVRDVSPGAGSGVEELTAVGDRIFFVFGQTLWRTDGTLAGTIAVRSFDGSLGGGVAVDGALYFVVNETAGSSLWRSDGTTAGTVQLGPGGYRLTVAGTRLYYLRHEDATGNELWTSDGTPAGTLLLKDVCPGTCEGVHSSDPIVPVGTAVFFRGFEPGTGYEIWRSDGTPAGTAIVKDISPGPTGAASQSMAPLGGGVLFGTDFPTNALWRTDGTDAGTVLVRAIGVDAMQRSGAVVFMRGFEPATGYEVWTSDGTTAGTVRVTDGCAGTCSFLPNETRFAPSPYGVLFGRSEAGQPELWVSNGTAAGTVRLQSALTVDAYGPPTVPTYFAAHDAAHGAELWVTDGSPAGTRLVTDRAERSAFPFVPFGRTGVVGDRLFFLARNLDIGDELWTTRGSAATTEPFDLTPGPFGSGVFAGGTVNGLFVFSALAGGVQGSWRSDGAAAGTYALQPVPVQEGFTALGNQAFFGAGVNAFASEPWRTDGTPAGTFQVADVAPGAVEGSQPASFTPFQGRMFFVTRGGTRGLWRTDGTAANTSNIVTRPCAIHAASAQQLFLTCSDAATGDELWRSDGTAAGTRLVADLAPGLASTNIVHSAVLGDVLYFTTPALEMWRSDGTAAGTRFAADALGVPLPTEAERFTVSNGVLYFSGRTTGTGHELWRTDGTAAGTFLLRDIRPGPDSGLLDDFAADTIVAVDGGVVFAAYTPERGLELWQSDGTTAGTVPLPEIVPGPASSSPSQLVRAGGTVYAAATDGVTGYELWAVPVTTPTIVVGDATIAEGDAGTRDAVFAVHLLSPPVATVTVSYATVAGTAQAGTDFTPRAGVLTFASGASVATVAVPIVGDLADEDDEEFTLALSASGPVVLADPEGVAQIRDDDGPRLSAQGTSVVEGDAGTTDAPFVLTLTTKDGTPTPAARTFAYVAEAGTATAGVDFDAASGTLTFASGTASGTTTLVHVAVRGDVVDEPDELFGLRLSATGDANVDAPGTAGIADDDGIASARPVELIHGAVVRADLAPPAGRTQDRDYYVLAQQPFASYEAVVDETSGDAGALALTRVAADGTTVLQSAVPVGTGGSLSLRWQTTAETTDGSEHLRVESAACGSACGPDDAYRMRLYETTLSAPRFNNVGAQATVIILQNASSLPVSGHVFLWADAASGAQAFTIAPHGTYVLNTSQLLFGLAGSITVSHDGPYGGLVGKAVALEPATGFSFDTPLTSRPR